ncbi:GNAT family N-acetyltransferase [Actinosynnema sp. CS-041913]|uniref:GNAT family N-acetyltransferase n=1 Tax=Actinosynnema sp. CS-041913 TaxID=3239917 RepID=UPI003D8D95DF
MDIRPVREGEADRLRSLRLQALDDAPHAYFWPREAEEAVDWTPWTTSADRVMFVVEDDDVWLGMAGCSLRGDGSGVLDATGMWVSPSARGQSLGERLIDAIVKWGRERGATVMEFAVTDDNTAAIALYTRLGFTPTGRRRNLVSDPSRTGIFMAKGI